MTKTEEFPRCDSVKGVYMISILKALAAFISLGYLGACGTKSGLTGDSGDKKSYEVCKHSNEDGTTYDNCAFGVLEDGTCGERALKVVSEKPANEYSCMTEL